jgi:hypothetical protein
MKETRSVLKTNCRDSLDHMQPMWFRSFRSELSRVVNYCRGVQKIQGEFRCIFSETRAGTKGVARHRRAASTSRVEESLGAEARRSPNGPHRKFSTSN